MIFKDGDHKSEPDDKKENSNTHVKSDSEKDCDLHEHQILSSDSESENPYQNTLRILLVINFLIF